MGRVFWRIERFVQFFFYFRNLVSMRLAIYPCKRKDMAITKDKKQTIHDTIIDGLKGSESVVFVNFHGLGVTDTTHIRHALREKGLSYYVAKKTLLKRALDEIGVEGTRPELAGEIAIAYGNDPVAPAHELYAFAKKHKGNLEVVGGVLEGTYLSANEAIALAQLPSQHELQGMVVNVMYAPVSGFVRTLNATIGQCVQVLDQIAKAKQA